ncbi:MAG: DUF308 domain-containing protein [Clostridia bacterium]|nr:DUF308 domain-containing protein [Clostridia bacterium]
MYFFEKTKWDRSVIAFIYLILGIVLLLFPKQTLSIATRIIAFGIMSLAVIYIVMFIIKKEDRFSADYFYLIISIVGIGLAISMIISPTWIIAVINIVVGIVLIINGIGNFSTTVMIRKDDKIWWAFSILPIITFVLGFVIMANPIGMAKFMTRIEGLSLITDAVSTWIIVYRLNKFLS